MNKLLIYVENYLFGGLEKFLFDFIDNIKNTEVFLIFNENNLRIKEFAIKNSIKYKLAYIKRVGKQRSSKNRLLQYSYKAFTLFMIYFNRLLNHYYLKKLFKNYLDYDNFLIINGGYPAAESCKTAAIVGKKLGFKNILFSILSTPINYSRYRITRYIDQYQDIKVMNSVNYFIGNCEMIRKELHRKRNFHLEKIKTIYTGVKIKENVKKTNNILNSFISLEKKKDDVWIGTVGYLYELKGQKFLIDSLKSIDVKNKLNLKCLIVGEGPDLIKLKELTKLHELENCIIFTGKYPFPIEDIYSFIDIFVSTSLHEGLPYVISEAMMFKLPIISTNVGGVPEQIQNNINGFLVEPKNSNEIANALEKLIDMKDQWEKIGNENFEKAKAIFSIDKMIKDYLELLI